MANRARKPEPPGQTPISGQTNFVAIPPKISLRTCWRVRKDENKDLVKVKFLCGREVPAPGTYKLLPSSLLDGAHFLAVVGPGTRLCRIDMKIHVGNIESLSSSRVWRISQIR